MSLLVALLMIAAEPTPAEHIDRGRAALDSLDYEVAALELTLAASDERATEDERIEANLYAGIANRILGRDTDARLNFVYVLKRRPDIKLPDDAPPKITGFFNLVREEVAASSPPPPPSTNIFPAALTISGGVLAIGGAIVGAIATTPYLAHADARAELDALAASGADGTAAQARQQQARAEWESWGALTSTIGFATAAVGAVGAAVGAAMWMME